MDKNMYEYVKTNYEDIILIENEVKDGEFIYKLRIYDKETLHKFMKDKNITILYVKALAERVTYTNHFDPPYTKYFPNGYEVIIRG